MNEQLEVNLDDSDSILLLKFRAEGVGLEVPTQGDLASLWGMAVAGCSMEQARISMKFELRACRGIVN